jgi:hypothetical protein
MFQSYKEVADNNLSSMYPTKLQVTKTEQLCNNACSNICHIMMQIFLLYNQSINQLVDVGV